MRSSASTRASRIASSTCSNHILRPELFDLVAPLRTLLGEILQPKRTGEVQLTLVDQGVDLLLKGIEPEGLRRWKR